MPTEMLVVRRPASADAGRIGWRVMLSDGELA